MTKEQINYLENLMKAINMELISIRENVTFEDLNPYREKMGFYNISELDALRANGTNMIYFSECKGTVRKYYGANKTSIKYLSASQEDVYEDKMLYNYSIQETMLTLVDSGNKILQMVVDNRYDESIINDIKQIPQVNNAIKDFLNEENQFFYDDEVVDKICAREYKNAQMKKDEYKEKAKILRGFDYSSILFKEYKDLKDINDLSLINEQISRNEEIFTIEDKKELEDAIHFITLQNALYKKAQLASKEVDSELLQKASKIFYPNDEHLSM